MRRLAGSKKGEILLYDVIGGFFGGISARGFARQLKELGDVDEISLRINSPGGEVFDATAIYNQLKGHKAKKTVYVDGLAASAASFIMLVGDEITIAKNAYVMIHNASSLMWGDRRALRKEADLLQKMDGQIAAMYAARGNKSVEEFSALMDEESWFTGAEAKELGLADSTGEERKPKNSFDLAKFGFRRVPQSLLSSASPAGRSGAQTAQPFIGVIAACGSRESLTLDGVPKMTAVASTPANSSTKPAEAPKNPPAAAVEAAPAAPAAAAVAAPAAPDRAAIEAEALAKANKRAGAIISLCAMGQMPEKAEAFINDAKLSVDDVREQVTAAWKAKNPAVGQEGAAAGEAKQTKDPDEEFRAEFRANKARYDELGTSEEDFVRSRRIDEGLDTLQPKAKPAAKPAAAAK